jgi:hypothetical protein
LDFRSIHQTISRPNETLKGQCQDMVVEGRPWSTYNKPKLRFANVFFRLKGQCHEMVVEVRPWSGRLGLN